MSIFQLAIAWAKDEITYTQVLTALNRQSTMQAYVTLARSLREGFRRGIIK